MRVLLIHVGNPININAKDENSIVKMNTILNGVMSFREKDLINHIRTRDSISNLEGIDLHYICFTDRKSI